MCLILVFCIRCHVHSFFLNTGDPEIEVIEVCLGAYLVNTLSKVEQTQELTFANNKMSRSVFGSIFNVNSTSDNITNSIVSQSHII